MSILDKTFHYVPASKTDIRKTFKRIRAELAAKKAAETANVRPIKKAEAK